VLLEGAVEWIDITEYGEIYTDSLGNYVFGWVVPTDFPEGTHTFRMRTYYVYSPELYSDQVTITIAAVRYTLSIETDKDVVYVGETLIFSGYLIDALEEVGVADATIDIEMYDPDIGAWVKIGDATTDGIGHYVFYWTVPTIAPGTYRFRSVWY